MNFSTFAYFQSYLDSLGLFSMNLGLERMHQALGILGLARPKAMVVHVLGTNGKGSTAGFVEALARAHGLRTGLYISPHLVQIRERIRINGRQLPEKDWLAGANAVLSSCSMGLTYFEVLTVMAVYLFEQNPLDLIILEAGLGGTHDATTAISADLSIMTPVALDHEHVLGPTLAHIATDKAGALGRCPAVLALQDPLVRNVFTKAMGAEPWDELQNYAQGQGFYFPRAELSITQEVMDEHAPYQVANAALAVLAWSILSTLHGWQFQGDLCTQILRQTYFPGRFVRHGSVLVDGAHNNLGLEALCTILEERGEHFDVLIFQAMSDKILDQHLLDRLAKIVDRVLIPDLSHIQRSTAPEDLAARFGAKGQTAPSLAIALNGPGSVLLCGSLYLVGEYYALHPEHLEY